MDAVAVDDGRPLSDTLQKLPSTLDTAKAALDRLDGPLGDTASAFSTMEPGLRGLGDATPDTRAFLRESPTPLDKLPDVSNDAKPAVSDLTHTFSDTQPLAPRVRETFKDAAEPLDVLKPYALDTEWWVTRLRSFVSESVAPGIHYANANANVGLQTPATGSVLQDKLTLPRDPYPKPGAASSERAPGLGGK
jgi:phospholipid/cholesterol/gamma-HCH transport system substrate-binding protein